jgi:hypothetical protein
VDPADRVYSGETIRRPLAEFAETLKLKTKKSMPAGFVIAPSAEHRVNRAISYISHPVEGQRDEKHEAKEVVKA